MTIDKLLSELDTLLTSEGESAIIEDFSDEYEVNSGHPAE